MSALEYQLWDVFTATAFAGNQLAVVPHADSLDTATMQRIANEPVCSKSPGPSASNRLRIWRQLTCLGADDQGATKRRRSG